MKILESEREKCVELDLITPLKDPLQFGLIQDKIESCRAIGNMCYENGLNKTTKKETLISFFIYLFI